MAPTRPLNPPPVTVTYQDVVDALRKAVIDKGENYVYENETESCRYFDASGQPSCIVGHALSQWGVAPFRFNETLNGSGVGNLFREHVIADPQRDFDFKGSQAYRTLRLAQRRQDSGTSWGRVLEQALKEGGS